MVLKTKSALENLYVCWIYNPVVAMRNWVVDGINGFMEASLYGAIKRRLKKGMTPEAICADLNITRSQFEYYCPFQDRLD